MHLPDARRLRDEADDPEAVEERYGVPPARYPELAALVGETSDNLPGVPGVGQGYAAKWLNQYDGLDNVITHADEITGKKGEALREHLADVIRNRRLNALVCDLELELAPADLAWPSWDRQAVHTLFDGLEFQVLRTRLLEALPTEEEAAIDDSGFDVSMRVLGDGELAGWLADHASAGAAGRHPPGRPLAGRHRRPARRWRSRPRRAPPTSPPTSSTSPTRRRWPPGSRTPSKPKVLHDAKGPMLAFAARGMPLAGPRARHRAVGLPRPARPALLRPGRPDRPLPQARAAAGAGRRRPAQPRGPRR